MKMRKFFMFLAMSLTFATVAISCDKDKDKDEDKRDQFVGTYSGNMAIVSGLSNLGLPGLPDTLQFQDLSFTVAKGDNNTFTLSGVISSPAIPMVSIPLNLTLNSPTYVNSSEYYTCGYFIPAQTVSVSGMNFSFSGLAEDGNVSGQFMVSTTNAADKSLLFDMKSTEGIKVTVVTASVD